MASLPHAIIVDGTGKVSENELDFDWSYCSSPSTCYATAAWQIYDGDVSPFSGICIDMETKSNDMETKSTPPNVQLRPGPTDCSHGWMFFNTDSASSAR